MSKRVTDVVFENCTATVYYSDCTHITFDISNCGDKTPEEQKPGDSPDPHPTPDVRCRVAVHMAAQIVTSRYIDFLNAATPASVASFGVGLAGVVSAKLAAWAWSVALYPDLYAFGFTTVTSGDRDTALTAYDADPDAVLFEVGQALYCVLPETGAIDETTRELFRGVLNGLGGALYTRLAEFLGIYPLERLRDEAFEASITTDAVDCELFDCDGSPSGSACAPVDITWSSIGVTPAAWENIAGNIDASAWDGDTSAIEECGVGLVDYTASRSSLQAWLHSGAAGQCIGVGLRYTPDAPCVVSHVAFDYQKNTGNSIALIIAVKRASDGVYQVLSSQVRAAIQPLSGALVWSGSPIAATEIVFLVHSGSSTGTFEMRITKCKVNDP